MFIFYIFIIYLYDSAFYLYMAGGARPRPRSHRPGRRNRFMFGMHYVLDDKIDKLYKNKYGKFMGVYGVRVRVYYPTRPEAEYRPNT